MREHKKGSSIHWEPFLESYSFLLAHMWVIVEEHKTTILSIFLLTAYWSLWFFPLLMSLLAPRRHFRVLWLCSPVCSPSTFGC